MHKINNKILENIITLSVSGVIIISFYLIINNLGLIKDKFIFLLNILKPFIWGFFIAFILSGLTSKIEDMLPSKLKGKTKRVLASISSLIIAITLVVLFLLILIPEVLNSILDFASNAQGYINGLATWINEISIKFNISGDLTKSIIDNSENLIDNVLLIVKENLPSLINTTYTTISSITSFIFSLAIAIYMLIDKEHLQSQIKKLAKAFLSKSQINYIKNVLVLSIEKFNSFISGRIVESSIVGVLCFIAMSLIKLDYALLISFIVGITNIIPVVGPFIGAIPCALLLLLVNPIQVLWFSIMILILQQIDGNIIGPYILGDSMGLSGLSIMLAILVGGGLFGVWGILLGVPIFSITYHLFKDYVNRRIIKRSAFID